MVHRRNYLLYLLEKTHKPISNIKIQLLIFFCMQDNPTNHYQYIPSESGPLSLVLEDDLIALTKKGLLQVDEDSILHLSPECKEAAAAVAEEDKAIIDEVLAHFDSLTEDDLLIRSVALKPFYGIHLPEDTLVLLKDETQSQISAIQKDISKAERSLYTIGYEKISLDQFIQDLLLVGVKNVVDVRETTTSRRREFSKNPLELACSKARITYISMPEVGIPSHVRNEILKEGTHQDLLVWYKEHVRSQISEYATEIAHLVSKENTALMCYEHDPLQCHRSLFAQFCLEEQPGIPSLTHLRIPEPEVPSALL